MLPLAALLIGAWAVAVLPAGSPPPLAWLPAVLVLLWAGLLRRWSEASLPLAARRSAIAVLLLLVGRYLLWRASATLNLSSAGAAALSLLLLASEAYLLGHALLQLLPAWFREPPVAEEARRAAAALREQINRDPGRLPAVDVVLPSCGEPLALLERSLRGCLALTYPRLRVWLLDDSDRPELAALCRRLGCDYLTRRERAHAKAGNLNHALAHLPGELLVVFDADVVPQRPFLERTVGLFSDPRVALVQTPQSYMNADPVIRNLELERWLMPDEEYFYRWIEPTRQAVGAVVCAGTSFVVRHSALEQVGGFETGTPSEDLATGIRLTAAGYRCLYLNDKLSAGLAPFSIAAMAAQRSRWASGTLQTLRTGANPLRIPGLTLRQRLAFLEGILHWFNVLPQLLLLLMPLSFGVLNSPPLLLRDQGVVLVALPLLLAQLLLVRWFSHDARSALMPELYRWVFLSPLLLAVLSTAAGRPRLFRVTPKTARSGPSRPALGLALPLLLLLAAQLANVVLVLRGPSPLLPLLWSGLAIASLLAALQVCRDRPLAATATTEADAEALWFRPSDGAVTLSQGRQRWAARITAISEAGVELSWAASAGISPTLAQPVRLEAPWLAAPGWLLRPERLQRGVAGGRRLRLGARWPADPAQQLRLQALLYQQPQCWPVRRAPAEPLALLALLLRLPRRQHRQDWFRRSCLPLQLRAPPQLEPAPAVQP